MPDWVGGGADSGDGTTPAKETADAAQTAETAAENTGTASGEQAEAD